MGTDTNKPHRYAAFISYAHADEVMAARLHKALETYAVPRHLRKQGKTTKPVFRDVAELTAAHSLSEKIRDAVKGSRVLIVLCSPAAKASHWVNEEIRLFRKLHGDASILSAIIEGTPETAFPDALIEGGREPLAAALGSDKAGFRLGVTQLAAGMLGTGLDDLVQRESKRRNRLMGAGLAASLALSGIMGFATFQAVEARNEAQLERSESEALLDYMVKDLKVKLEPVGRLELLEGVGRKAIDYYDKKEIADLSDDNLRLLAAARQVIAQVALDAGRMDEAQKEIETSAVLTREVLERNPDDTDAIYAHAQSEFWVGKYYFDQGHFAEVEPYFKEYNRLSQMLHETDPMNFEWIMEAAWSANAMGAYYDRQRDYVQSGKAYEKAEEYAEIAIAQEPENPSPRRELANFLVGQARSALNVKSFDDVSAIRQELDKIYEIALRDDPKNSNLIFHRSSSKYRRYVDLDRFRAGIHVDGLNEAIESLEALIELDPENQKWTRRNVTAKFIRLNSFYTRGDIDSFSKLYDDYIEAVTEYLNANKNENKFERFSYELLKFRKVLIVNEKFKSDKALNKLNKLYHDVNFHNIADMPIVEFLLVENALLGNTEYAKVFARKYLESSAGDISNNTPSVLHSRAIAFTVLDDCTAAKSDAQNLVERGFLSPKFFREKCFL